nr:hypothetical protein L484_027933 [Ipomoea trifida]
MHQALQAVTANPNPKRNVGPLGNRAPQHHDRDDHESQVPHHVQSHHRLGVAPVGAALVQLPSRRLAHQHRSSSPPRHPPQQRRQRLRAAPPAIEKAIVIFVQVLN